jgi:hypothetical protein
MTLLINMIYLLRDIDFTPVFFPAAASLRVVMTSLAITLWPFLLTAFIVCAAAATAVSALLGTGAVAGAVANDMDAETAKRADDGFAEPL